MKLSLLIFPILVVFALFAHSSSAAPQPGNFFKDLEEMGQRVNSAILKAGPAIQVLQDARDLFRSEEDEDDD